MLQSCLKCHKDNELPEGHKLRVCQHCGVIQAKIPTASAATTPAPKITPSVTDAAIEAPKPKPTKDTANPPQLIGCETCGHQIARLAVTCPSCGAPNNQAPKLVVEKPMSHWGGIAIACALAAILMPYFASVFLAPLATILALISITKGQAIAGLVALGMCLLAFGGIWQTSQKIEDARAQIGKSADEMRRIQQKLDQDLRDIKQKYQ